jgi:HAD superfamily hydrolase (TIGR01549 family)
MIKAIIFDLDGVLLNISWKGLFEAYDKLLQAEGKDYRDFYKNLEEFKQWWNPDWRKNEQRLGIKNKTWSHKIFYETVGRYTYLLPWVDDMLGKLSKKYQLSILTSRHKESTLAHLGSVARHFRIILGSDNVRNLKPHPEGINLILSKTKTGKKEALIIGDMSTDVQAGNAAGIKTGAVIWEYGLGTDEDFAELNPDYIFRTKESFDQLLQS